MEETSGLRTDGDSTLEEDSSGSVGEEFIVDEGSTELLAAVAGAVEGVDFLV